MNNYSLISAIEPLFPSALTEELDSGCLEIISSSAKLSSSFHGKTNASIALLVTKMNSYYSNLIEGHNTNPVDIDRALEENFSLEPAKRGLQIESRAHIEVNALMENKLRSDKQLNIASPGFLKWLHFEFYKRMPDEYKRIINKETGKISQVVPGELRKENVIVGRHVPPEPAALDDFLMRFAEFYDTANFDTLKKIIAAACSHHRLAWIHPFLDGNGRVTRLFTDAYLIRAGVNTHGLWSISRGFARFREAYISALANADFTRTSDLDGRGNLSEKFLSEFCSYFVKTAADQIKFMVGLYKLDNLLERYRKFIGFHTDLKPEAFYIIKEALLSGQVGRGDAARLTGKPERTARNILAAAIKANLLVSDTPKGPVRIYFPAECLPYIFPRLYPPSAEADIEVSG